MMQVVATSSPTGLNEPIAVAQNHRLFSKSLERSERSLLPQKGKSLKGVEHGIAAQLQNGAIELFLIRVNQCLSALSAVRFWAQSLLPNAN